LAYDPPAPVSSPDQVDRDLLVLRFYRELMQKLTRRQKSLIEEYYAHGKSASQVGHSFRISEGAVRKRAFDIAKLVRRVVSADGKLREMAAYLSMTMPSVEAPPVPFALPVPGMDGRPRDEV